MTVEHIAEQALQLTPSARAQLAELLLASLDYEQDISVSEQWQQEIAERCQQIDNNPGLLLDGEQVMQELKQRYL